MTHIEPSVKWRNKIRKKKLRKVKKRKMTIFGTTTGSEEREGGEEREKGKKKRFFHFFLRSTEIEPSVFLGARRKVDPRIASYA